MTLDLSGIQHYVFCKRQWALMYLENVWEENADTMLGNFIHERVDDPYFEEKRKNKIIVRSMPIFSNKLKFSGKCDVVEFIKSKNGVPIRNYSDLWEIHVVEYKKGKQKKDNSDLSQLTAQVICLEEMFHTKISKSSIYYKSENKRLEVEITDELRRFVEFTAKEMFDLLSNKTTPKAVSSKKCNNCSLKEKCIPRLTHHKKNVIHYINEYMEEL